MMMTPAIDASSSKQEAGPKAGLPPPRSNGRSDRGGLDRERTCSDLVEAGAAIDGPVIARRERHNRLAATRAADRGVELPWTAGGSGAFRDCATRGAAL